MVNDPGALSPVISKLVKGHARAYVKGTLFGRKPIQGERLRHKPQPGVVRHVLDRAIVSVPKIIHAGPRAKVIRKPPGQVAAKTGRADIGVHFEGVIQRR